MGGGQSKHEIKEFSVRASKSELIIKPENSTVLSISNSKCAVKSTYFSSTNQKFYRIHAFEFPEIELNNSVSIFLDREDAVIEDSKFLFVGEQISMKITFDDINNFVNDDIYFYIVQECNGVFNFS